VAAAAEDDGGGGDDDGPGHGGVGGEVEAVPLGDAVAEQRADDEEREAPEQEIRDRVPLQLHVHPADGERDHGLRRIGGAERKPQLSSALNEKKAEGQMEEESAEPSNRRRPTDASATTHAQEARIRHDIDAGRDRAWFG
jgi:hypothetical protein